MADSYVKYEKVNDRMHNKMAYSKKEETGCV